MDITSYLLGKNASGGGGSEKYFVDTVNATNASYVVKSLLKEIPEITLASNLTTLSSAFQYCTELVTAPPITNMEQVTDTSNMFEYCSKLINVPNYNTTNVTSMSYMFDGCSLLETAPQFDTSKTTSTTSMFSNCAELKNVPQYNFENATALTNMFRNCLKLTDESLNNVLASCITVTNKYTDTKTLKRIGINNYSAYPTSRIQALPHYQDFISAGWSIGY